MVSISEYSIKQGLEELNKLGYNQIKFDNLEKSDINKKNSLITIFNDNKARFTADGMITPDTIKSFINITYSGVIPATFKTLPNIKKLVEILGYIITLIPDLSVTSRVIQKQPKESILSRFKQYMDKYPQFQENYPKEDDDRSIRKWASGILNLLNMEEISINTIREFRDNMYQLIRKNTPTTDTEKIMLKIVKKLNTIIPAEDKRSNLMLCISIDTYIVHILYEHVLKESVIQQYYAISSISFIYRDNIGNIVIKRLYIGETNQDGPTVQVSEVIYLNMQVFENMKQTRNDDHDQQYKEEILDKIIDQSSKQLTSGLDTHISSFLCMCQLLMDVLLYAEEDDKDSRKLIEEALNESIELAPEYTSKFDTLMKKLTDTEDNEMILLLQPQLEHFRLNKSKYGGSYKVAEYDTSSLKQYNISCFYALCLTELRDGKYLINKSYFREFQWITHLDNRLHTKATFPNKFQVQSYETLGIQEYRPVGNIKQRHGLSDADKKLIIYEFNLQSAEKQEQLREITSIWLIL